MSLFFALLLILVLLACWPLTLFGLPGNWLMTAATAFYALLVPAQSRVALGWKTVVVLVALAALGELVEILAAALGVSKAGGSRRGAVLALAGSVLGGVVGLLVGVPVPLVGPVIAAVLFAGLGAAAGAAAGEIWARRDAGTTWRIAKLAFWGRLAGTAGKLVLGAVMIVAVMAALTLR
jgi:uncharacterized protein YqgC (DUF456 family)